MKTKISAKNIVIALGLCIMMACIAMLSACGAVKIEKDTKFTSENGNVTVTFSNQLKNYVKGNKVDDKTITEAQQGKVVEMIGTTEFDTYAKIKADLDKAIKAFVDGENKDFTETHKETLTFTITGEGDSAKQVVTLHGTDYIWAQDGSKLTLTEDTTDADKEVINATVGGDFVKFENTQEKVFDNDKFTIKTVYTYKLVKETK